MPKEKEITLLPRKKVAPKAPITLLERILFVVAIFVLAVWAGEIYYKKNLGDNVKDLTILIEAKTQERDRDLELEIYLTGERLKSLTEVVTTHSYWTKIFTKLEDLTVPIVWFSDFRAQDLGEMTLDGWAANYSTLARQFVSFRQDPMFKEVVLSSIKRSETGEVGFTFKLLFDPETLLK